MSTGLGVGQLALNIAKAYAKVAKAEISCKRSKSDLMHRRDVPEAFANGFQCLEQHGRALSEPIPLRAGKGCFASS